MGRSHHDYPKRLTEEQALELATLRARVALLDAKGKTGTCHHETLARLEAAAAAPSAPAEATPRPGSKPAAPEEPNDGGTA